MRMTRKRVCSLPCNKVRKASRFSSLTNGDCVFVDFNDRREKRVLYNNGAQPGVRDDTRAKDDCDELCSPVTPIDTVRSESSSPL